MGINSMIGDRHYYGIQTIEGEQTKGGGTDNRRGDKQQEGDKQ